MSHAATHSNLAGQPRAPVGPNALNNSRLHSLRDEVMVLLQPPHLPVVFILLKPLWWSKRRTIFLPQPEAACMMAC